MIISVVSVAYNEEKNISKTIKSVLSQTSNNIEYIICDGQSTDNTVKIAESYKDAFAQKNIKYIVNTEKDSGIYDGMNKGIQMASGDYIFFLNAGDWFYKDDIIERIITIAEESDLPDFIYGNVAVFDRGVVHIAFGDDTCLSKGMSIPHQALFSRTKLMKTNLFDVNYKIVADYKFVLSQKLENKRFYKINDTVAYFSRDGLSNNSGLLGLEEQEKVRREYGVFQKAPFEKIQIYKGMLIIEIKKFIPQKLWELWSVKIRKKQLYNEINKEE